MLQKQILEIDGEQLVCEFDIREVNAVLLHGAGKSNRQRMYGLAEALQARGIGVVVFDFSGHGESTGHLSELSLERRMHQAQAVIDSLVPADSPLYLIGFSMGGQTVSDILPLYMEWTKGVLLCCPAMYSERAWRLPFGNSDREFTQIIRTPGSWQESLAPKHMAAYKGRVIVAAGSEDAVIPHEAIDAWWQSAQQAEFVEYKGVSHRLSLWYLEHPTEATAIIEKLLV